MKKAFIFLSILLSLFAFSASPVGAQNSRRLTPAARLTAANTVHPTDSTQMKEQLAKKISRTIDLLNRLWEQIKNKPLPEETKNKLTAQIQTAIDWLTEKQEQLKSAQTPQEIQQIRREMNQHWPAERKNIKQAIRNLREKRQPPATDQIESQSERSEIIDKPGKWDNIQRWFGNLRSRYFRLPSSPPPRLGSDPDP